MSDEPYAAGDEPYAADEPAVDAELLRRDDEALDAVGAPRDALSWDDDSDPEPGDQDAVLRLLRALRDDVDAAEDDVAATVLALHGRPRRLGARGLAIASVAAVVLSAGGVAAASVGAAPGSLLYPIRQVMTFHHAPNAGLVALGRLLDNAEKAIEGGRLTAAHAQLDAAQRRAESVAGARLSSSEQKAFADDQARLTSLRDRLTALEAAASVSGPGKSGSAPGKGGTTSKTPETSGHPTGSHGTRGHSGDKSSGKDSRHTGGPPAQPRQTPARQTSERDAPEGDAQGQRG